ncbi:imidazole glycerol phosphate synthase cyclase subunit [Roseitalea porphyridii]|uniref:Imidazole glycerol phosphate synthase subunit HisF n=1 Tax=Roseitalea porphyridii TaxID=1852022 RepID=A0A4P6V0E9_9HYPH|nr:imidazole glycerol phosphate synthase cyclase subunit [Roseitalea porphyridii]
MLRSRVAPYLLLRGKGLVKTQKFGNAKYVGDPINAVKIFNEKEVDELTLLDIDATASGRGPDLTLLKDIAAESRMPLCYGGGVQDAEMAARIIALGYEKVSVSHAALERPALVREMADRIGRQSVVVTIDVKKEGLLSGKHKVYSRNAKQAHKVDPIDFAMKCTELGAGEIVLNSIDRDGMMQGYGLDLARKLRGSITTPMTVVGGAGSIDDLRALTNELGPVGAGAGSLFVFKGKYRAVLISYARP